MTPKDISCPTCGVGVGDDCVGAATRLPMFGFHTSRGRLASALTVQDQETEAETNVIQFQPRQAPAERL